MKCIDDEIPFEIPEGWSWVRLKSVAEVARGGSPRPIKDYITESKDGINWIKIGDTEKDGKYINQTREKIIPAGLKKSRLIHKGDFLLTNSMSFGRPYISNIEGCIHDGWLVISPIGDSFIQDYLYYLLSSRFSYDQFCGVVSGAVVQNLNSDKVASALFPLPPIEEQSRIVSILEEIIPHVKAYEHAQSELDKLNLSLLPNLKKSVLQEAIQGKLVPQESADEPASVLLDRIGREKQRLLSEGKLKKKDISDSVIFKGEDNKYYEKVGNDLLCLEDEVPFELPQSWAWVRLNDICEYIQRGKSPKYSEIKKCPVVAQKCNQWSGFSLEKALFIDPNTLSSYGQERFLQHGDLLWNSTGLGTLGRMAIYNEAINPYGIAVADSHVTVIRPIKSHIDIEYLYLYFSSNEVQSVIEDKADGSTKQKELATKTIKAYLVPLPPLSEQHRIVAKYHSVASIMSR